MNNTRDSHFFPGRAKTLLGEEWRVDKEYNEMENNLWVAGAHFSWGDGDFTIPGNRKSRGIQC